MLSRMTPRYIAIVLATLIIDQLHKLYTMEMLHNIGRPIEITSFFNIVLVWNSGISFGMFQNSANGQFIFSCLAIIIVILLFFWLKKTDSNLKIASIGLITGGALGNVVDRIHFGGVADFFDFHIAGYHWPAFNIADIAIFIGAIILSLESIFRAYSDYDKS